MSGLIRYIVAGFLCLVIVFAAFSPQVVLMYEKTVNKEDVSLASAAGTEKKTCEIKELLPEEAFVGSSGFELQQPGDLAAGVFAHFRDPYIQTQYTRIPTPPPRMTL